MTEIRVVAAVADEQKVIFYQENGETITLQQTDPRLVKVMEVVLPLNTRGEVAIIDLDDYSVYREYEEKQETKGFVKFFKAAKSAMKSVLGGGSEAPVMKREELVAPQEAPTPSVPTPAPVETKVAEIKVEPKKPTPLATHGSHLKPLGNDEDLRSDETIVAVIGDMIIPNMEKLRPYLSYALKHNSTKSVEAFLRRIIPHIEKRGHSIEDLMSFMQKGDMPITEDGCIIGYKALAKTNEEGVFVDKHTKNVKQRVGSYVCVNEELVDRNRSNECSNGLHIARRSYLKGFADSGDVIVLIKLAPEDVVTVPHRDPSKVRAMGYHIVGLINESGKISVMKNEPMTRDNESSNFIANVIKGNHIIRTNEVRIGGQMGSNITYTDLVEITEKVKLDKTIKTKAFDHDPVSEGKPISPRTMNKQITEELNKSKTETVNNPPTPEGEKVIKQALTEAPKETSAQRSARIKREKRAAKKAAEASKQEAKATPAKAPVKAGSKPVTKPKPPVITKASTPKVTPSKKPVVTKAKEVLKINEPKKPMTINEQARKLFNDKSYQALRNLKANSKKSYKSLGFNETEIEKITK